MFCFKYIKTLFLLQLTSEIVIQKLVKYGHSIWLILTLSVSLVSNHSNFWIIIINFCWWILNDSIPIIGLTRRTVILYVTYKSHNLPQRVAVVVCLVRTQRSHSHLSLCWLWLYNKNQSTRRILEIMYDNIQFILETLILQKALLGIFSGRNIHVLISITVLRVAGDGKRGVLLILCYLCTNIIVLMKLSCYVDWAIWVYYIAITPHHGKSAWWCICTPMIAHWRWSVTAFSLKGTCCD